MNREYRHIYGAWHPGQYGIATRGLRAVVVKNVGGAMDRNSGRMGEVVEQDDYPDYATGRTARAAARKLAVQLDWDVELLPELWPSAPAYF